jgi:hypothetical protein
MNTINYHREEGYRQGLMDGKRTGGRISQRYIKNVFKAETKHLSYEESIEYKIGWQDGFINSVSSVDKTDDNENQLIYFSEKFVTSSQL